MEIAQAIQDEERVLYSQSDDLKWFEEESAKNMKEEYQVYKTLGEQAEEYLITEDEDTLGEIEGAIRLVVSDRDMGLRLTRKQCETLFPDWHLAIPEIETWINKTLAKNKANAAASEKKDVEEY